MRRACLALLVAVLPAASCAGRSSKPFSFAVFGDNRAGGYDIRQPEVFKQILREIKARNPAFVIGTGDHIKGYQYNEQLLRRMWRGFLDALKIVEPIPVWIAVGNHDVFDGMSGRLYDEYVADKCGGRYYAMEHGGSAFLFLDAETEINRVQGKQFEWLKAQLKKYRDRDNVFVCIHKPIFRPKINGELKPWWQTLDHYDPEKEKGPPQAWLDLVDLLSRSNVRMVFAGHYHMFDMDHRHGILQWITGGGGSSLDEEDTSGKLFYHYLWVEVDGKKVDVEVVRPDLSKVKEPVVEVQAPAALEDFEKDESPNSWAMWDEGVRGEARPAPAAGAGRAFRLLYDFTKYEYPLFMLGLEPVQTWRRAGALTFDAYLPEETPAKGLWTLSVSLSAGDKSYGSPDLTLKHGWNRLTLPLDRPVWKWAHGSEKKRIEIKGVPVDLAKVSPLSTVSVMLWGYERKDSGTVWLDNFRLE